MTANGYFRDGIWKNGLCSVVLNAFLRYIEACSYLRPEGEYIGPRQRKLPANSEANFIILPDAFTDIMLHGFYNEQKIPFSYI